MGEAEMASCQQAGEGSMLRREWPWKKSVLRRLSGEVFIVFHSDQLLGAGERGGMFYSGSL